MIIGLILYICGLIISRWSAYWNLQGRHERPLIFNNNLFSIGLFLIYLGLSNFRHNTDFH